MAPFGFGFLYKFMMEVTMKLNYDVECKRELLSVGVPLPGPQCNPGMSTGDLHHHPLTVPGKANNYPLYKKINVQCLTLSHSLFRLGRPCPRTTAQSCSPRTRGSMPPPRLYRTWRQLRKLANKGYTIPDTTKQS